MGHVLPHDWVVQMLNVHVLSPTHDRSNDIDISLSDDDDANVLPRLGFRNVMQDAVEDYGLYLMQETLLWGLNRTLKDVGMVTPSRDWDSLLSNHLLQDHMQFDPIEEGQLLVQTVPLLNHKQCLAFDQIMESILSDKKCTFFVIGAAGMGKTFLYNTLCHAVRSHMLVMLCVTYSGIAA